nr:unnamed protein product [Callosobruchus analis]
MRLQSLVTKPLVSFKDLVGKNGSLQSHENHIYHKRAVQSAEDFIKFYHDPNRDVANQLDKKRLAEIEDHRNRLKAIIETIIFLGRQNIPFRGHRDDGEVLKTHDMANEGNFRELIRFRIKGGDSVLETHLRDTSSRATYISKTSQNEFIKLCGEEIRQQIISRITEAGIYSLLFDETTDISGKSQISLSLRYVSDGFVREDFICFVDAFEELENSEETELSLSGIALGRLVRSKLRRYKLDPARCIGIGCDSCAVNVSDTVGAVREIQLEAVNAQKVPCYSHKLNNSLSITSKVMEVNCTIGIMKEVVSFFSSHPKRLAVLLKHLGAPLKRLCETRWVDRHDGVLQFLQDLPSICETLEEITGWRDTLTVGKASSLASSLQEPKFVVTLICLSDLLCVTLILSRTLQTKNTDLMQASKEVANLISVLTRRREEAEKEFSELWTKASQTAAALHITLTIPRRSGRQTMRANYQTESPEVYYRLTIYIPILDHFLIDIRRRFPQSVLDVFYLPALVPDCLLNISPKELEISTEQIFQHFKDILEIMGVEMSTGLSVLKAEVLLWREKWVAIRKSNPKAAVPSTAIEALHHCSQDVYFIVYQILKLLATLPVSNATPERTFSSLRRLKTWLRATMGQERLTGLALLSTHRDINIDINNIINQFAKSGNRRLPFVL